MTRTRTIVGLTIAITAAAALACGKGSASKSPTEPLGGAGANGSNGSNGSPSGVDSTGRSPASAPTSNGPVASFAVSPRSASVQRSYWLLLTGTARDANGVVVPVTAVWRSSNPGVAAVGDTGLVQGVAIGSAMIHASVDGYEDSALVTVVDTLPATPPPTSPPIDSSTPPSGNPPPAPPPGSDTTLQTRSR